MTTRPKLVRTFTTLAPTLTLNMALCVAIIVTSTLALAGCHRGYYRRQADAEAQLLIREKLNDQRWNQIDPSIETSVDSRMHDPFSADHPPAPPDDVVSHQFMHHVDGKPGYQHWHVNGDTDYVANPEWRSYLPLNERGVLVLDMDRAIQLSLIHSPDLQAQRETLYLSALDVSLERFGFDTQAFYGLSTFFRTQGSGAPGGASSSLELTPGPQMTRLERLGINGTNLVVGIANTVIWNFAGSNSQAASTLIDFSLIQPLLNGAGRQIVLESLTQAERTLLGNVRQLERFRRGFYLNVATGRTPGAGPNQAGNFLGAPAGGTANPGGFLGLLQTQQEIRIAEFNVRSLENVLEQFRQFFREERINLLQVRQAEQALYSAQQSLLISKVNYQNELDSFKLTLGLPPDLEIEIDDPFLSQFELIDDELLERQLEVNLLRDSIGVALEAISPKGGEVDGQEETKMEWSADLETAIEGLIPVVKKVEPFLDQLVGDDSELIEKDIERLESVTDQRAEELTALRKFIDESEIDYELEPTILLPESIESVGQLRMELNEVKSKVKLIRGSVSALVDNVNELVSEADELDKDTLTRRLKSDIIFEAPEIQTRLADLIIELTLIQARARTSAISLPQIDITSRAATAIACQFRRDLMNARASLVDQWRQIELVADDLESTLDIVVEGSVGSTGNNPFNLNFNTNQFGLGLQFDAPINRLAERNQYRATLIAYQQARRNFYNFEDAISQNLRTTIRGIEQNKVLFELNRRTITSAIQQVELAQFALKEPVRPGAGGQSSLGPTAADNLTAALNNLQGAQNGFLNVWVAYEVLRRGLDFDLGTMQLSPEGNWLDPGTIDEMYAFRAAEAFGIPAEQVCIPPDITFDDSSFSMDENSSEETQSPDSPDSDSQDYYDRADPNIEPDDPTVLPNGDDPTLDSLGSRRRRSNSGLFGPVLKNAGF